MGPLGGAEVAISCENR